MPDTCLTEVCRRHAMVARVTALSYILAAIGIFLDLIDVISICTIPDAIVFKSGVNVFSALVKLISFGVIVGAGTSEFLQQLEKAACFNADGMQLIAGLRFVYFAFVLVSAISAFLSLLLSPFSAYYGGKLTGIPYIK